MEPTATGPNRTGIAQAAKQVQLMLEAVDELSPPSPISTLRIDTERQVYITEADSVGSIPPPQKVQSKSRSKATTADTQAMSLLLDKLGERIAFERTGTRLYDALITKYLAFGNSQDSGSAPAGEAMLETLRKIRMDELGHFQMLCECVKTLGGDPTAQTPCADVSATASMGLMQVITDPRTTLAQSLSAILTAELTDNAGWELLTELATKVGQAELAGRFSEALATEEEHLETVRTWLQSLLMNDVGSPAV
jgi:bacterioferritin (cytochrome b1)